MPSAAMNQFAILFEGRVPTGGLNQNSLTQTAYLVVPAFNIRRLLLRSMQIVWPGQRQNY